MVQIIRITPQGTEIDRVAMDKASLIDHYARQAWEAVEKLANGMAVFMREELTLILN